MEETRSAEDATKTVAAACAIATSIQRPTHSTKIVSLMSAIVLWSDLPPKDLESRFFLRVDDATTVAEREGTMAPKEADINDMEKSDYHARLLFEMESGSATDGTTETSFSMSDSDDDDDDLADSSSKSFQPGDHIYAWCNGKVYQHHGIVLSCAGTSMVIADFTNMVHPEAAKSSFSSASSNIGSFSFGAYDKPGEMRILIEQNTETTPWKKVKYNANWKDCIMTRAGTVTLAKPDSPETILARTNFLLKNPSLVPPYNVMTSNCETVAFWCTTGEWSTLQVSNALKTAKILGVSGTGGGIAYVSASTVTTTALEVVACEGLWGWLGFTTVDTVVTVTPLAAMQPWLIPVIAVSGSVVVGSMAYNFYKCKKKWKETTKLMNEMFKSSSLLQ